MGVSALKQAFSEYRTMSVDALLNAQLEEIGATHKYLKPAQMKFVFEAPTAEYLQADATNKQRITNEGDTYDELQKSYAAALEEIGQRSEDRMSRIRSLLEAEREAN